MKRKDIQALHTKTIVELTRDLESKRLELTKIRLEKQMKHEKNNRLSTILKDDIARILTVMRQVQEREKAKK